jgi:hypothetical protein
VTDVAQLVRRQDDLEHQFAEAQHAREQAERERDEYHELYLEMMRIEREASCRPDTWNWARSIDARCHQVRLAV